MWPSRRSNFSLETSRDQELSLENSKPGYHTWYCIRSCSLIPSVGLYQIYFFQSDRSRICRIWNDKSGRSRSRSRIFKL